MTPPAAGTSQRESQDDGGAMPSKSANVKNEKQYEALKDKGMSKERAAKIANTPDASKKGGKASGSGKTNNDSSQGGTTAQKKKAGSKGGKATAKKNS
jgi:hypothetical protein